MSFYVCFCVTLVDTWQAIDRARDMVNTELTALAAESYSRAYGVSWNVVFIVFILILWVSK